jgi:tripartite-type tricarboxylate transporter receptor subunit TctC
MLDRRQFSGAALAAAAAPLGARAQEAAYPSGVVHAIAMFPPGSGADVKIRYYSNKLALKFGGSVVVDNKAGAMGYIATEFVARSKPDGLTIFIAPGSSMFAAAPVLFKSLKFDPINDFEHLTTLNYSAFVLCVASDSPAKSVPELTALLRKKGASGSYASIAPPSVAFGETYKSKFDLQAVEVKYKDQGPLIADVINGVVDFTCIDIITVAGLIKDGRLRPLCMATAERLKSIPDIPGAREAGIPGLDIKNWWSVSVPAKTPRAICDKLEKWFNEINAEPETVKFLSDNGSDPMPGDAASVKALLLEDTKNWREYARIAKIEPV